MLKINSNLDSSCFDDFTENLISSLVSATAAAVLFHQTLKINPSSGLLIMLMSRHQGTDYTKYSKYAKIQNETKNTFVCTKRILKNFFIISGKSWCDKKEIQVFELLEDDFWFFSCLKGASI